MILLAVYMLLGTGCAWWFDRDQMKQPVPYGDWPSIISLETTRIICLVLNVLFGPLWVTRAGYTSARSYIRVRLAFYRLKKVSKKVPHIHQLVLKLEESFYATERSSPSRTDQDGR